MDPWSWTSSRAVIDFFPPRKWQNCETRCKRAPRQKPPRAKTHHGSRRSTRIDRACLRLRRAVRILAIRGELLKRVIQEIHDERFRAVYSGSYTRAECLFAGQAGAAGGARERTERYPEAGFERESLRAVAPRARSDKQSRRGNQFLSR